ncbi:MAG: hypothetical protein AB4041_14050 [Microcystaceae cyanobacterium]
MIEPDKQKFSEEIQQLNNEDRQILLSLLQEYAGKLDSLNFQIEERITLYNNLSLIISCFFALLGIIYILTLHLYPKNILIIIPFLMIMIFSILLINRKKTKRRVIEKQAEILAIKLERLVRTTSQYQEKVENNYVRKIELDLRLADAEAALSYYYKLNKELNDLVNSLKK